MTTGSRRAETQKPEKAEEAWLKQRGERKEKKMRGIPVKKKKKIKNDKHRKEWNTGIYIKNKTKRDMKRKEKKRKEKSPMLETKPHRNY